jgi:HEPN domain-containing protein
MIMTNVSESTDLSGSYFVGQSLDWEAEDLPITLVVELPYWLFVPDCHVEITIGEHSYAIQIMNSFSQLFVNDITDSRRSCVYIGPSPERARFEPGFHELIRRGEATLTPRRCKTVLRIPSLCNQDVLDAIVDDGRRGEEAKYYLQALCAGHLPVVNRLVRQYRLATYDLFAHELSPWEVPIWFVEYGSGFSRIALIDYANWDQKPRHVSSDGGIATHQLIGAEDFRSQLQSVPQPGEIALLDAMSGMERGDYSGAVRRIVTAVEVILESVLREELMKHHPSVEVEERLLKSRGDFPGRLAQYDKLTGRPLPALLRDELETSRNLRHEIVHAGEHLSYASRGQAQRCVDTGRWVFNWLESLPERLSQRETPRNVLLRSLGGTAASMLLLFDSRMTPSGVVVEKPQFDFEVNDTT